MKVLQINSVCGFGSTGRIATDLYEMLEKKGHECVIAYGRGTAPKGVKTIKIGSNMDNYIHVAKTRLFDKHGFGSEKATLKFIEKIKKYDPDIIHLHNIHGYYINIEILFKYLSESGKKIIWTLHDCWSFTGHCSHFEYVGCDKWKKQCSQCTQKKEYPSSKIFDSSKWNYKKKKELFTSIDSDKLTIVTPSRWLADLVKKSYLKKYKVEVINNGIDLDIFKPTESNFREKYNLENKKIILGVTSVWTQRKGLGYFLELSKKLNEDYQIVIVGVSKKQKRELPKEIIGITRTNNIKELVEIYSTADIFFNPTLEDNFPTTNLEALACGLPIITFNTGGSTEILNNKVGKCINRKFEIENFDINYKAIDCIKQSKIFDKSNCYKKYFELWES